MRQVTTHCTTIALAAGKKSVACLASDVVVHSEIDEATVSDASAVVN